MTEQCGESEWPFVKGGGWWVDGGGIPVECVMAESSFETTAQMWLSNSKGAS